MILKYHHYARYLTLKLIKFTVHSGPSHCAFNCKRTDTVSRRGLLAARSGRCCGRSDSQSATPPPSIPISNDDQRALAHEHHDERGSSPAAVNHDHQRQPHRPQPQPAIAAAASARRPTRAAAARQGTLRARPAHTCRLCGSHQGQLACTLSAPPPPRPVPPAAAPIRISAEIARLSPLLSSDLLQSAPVPASATAEAADPTKKKKKVRYTPRAAAALTGLGQHRQSARLTS